MKRVLSILLCVILLATFAVPAFAAGTISFSMSPSATTLHKGNTVTFTVSVQSSEPATSYGFMLSYDSSALELVGGSCTVGGTLVSSFNNGFAFMFQNPTAYSGTVGTVTFKVKENAALGSYTVSGSASVKNGTAAVAASGSAKTITVACNHSFGSWTKVSEAAHKRTCSLCQKEESENHAWNSGNVTKQPTCKETGSKTFTCTLCSAVKTETIAKTTDHKYGSWTKANNTAHKRTCSVCSKEETSGHSWDGGKVTKQPTCKEDGQKTFTCTDCGATNTEKISKLTSHTYDHACDADCNICGESRAVAHNYSSSWSKNEKNHWQECSACKDKRSIAAHTPGPEATETDAQTCTTCGYVLNAALGHTHKFADSWKSNEKGHWHPCAGCEEKSTFAAHDFKDDYDPDCAICGYSRTVKSRPAEKVESNNRQEITLTQPAEKAETKPVEEAVPPETTEPTEETQISVEETEALTDPTEATTEETVTAETETPAEEKVEAPAGSFPWWIIAAAGTVLIIAIFVAIKKK